MVIAKMKMLYKTRRESLKEFRWAAPQDIESTLSWFLVKHKADFMRTFKYEIIVESLEIESSGNV